MIFNTLKVRNHNAFNDTGHMKLPEHSPRPQDETFILRILEDDRDPSLRSGF
jgi:hypothetical protein